MPHSWKKALSRRRWRLLAAAAAAAAAAVWLGYPASGGGDAAAPVSRPQVSLVRAQVGDVPRWLSVQGHVVALNEVEVRSRVEGRLERVHVEEGQEVAAGQRLFSLDASESGAQLRQATARRRQARAELDEARRQLARARELAGLGYLSSSGLDTAASRVGVLEAQEQAARAEEEIARVRDAHTRIDAPIAGRIGAIARRRGALVGPSDASFLVRIVQMDPVAVEFSVPERHLAALAAALREGPVEAIAEDEAGAVRGELVFVDNGIHAGTGTLLLKARFGNADRRLWPGAFVQVKVAAGADRGVATLPPQAVMEGAEGHFVYALDAGRKVRVRPVRLLDVREGAALVEGLPGGTDVVSEGHEGLREGMEVRVDAGGAA